MSDAPLATTRQIKCAELASRINTELSSGAFKNILTEHQADFHDFMIAQEIVKKYIRSHDCILYGGTAIDYALRLRGDKIYDDGELPDFDFWSPGHIETARDLVNILSDLIPNAKVYGTRAMFIRAMRISIGNNNWVADISYVPRELFDKIPTLTFDGMRIVHPHFQFSDLHSSLAFPYDNAPREVIFARCWGDIARYNKLLSAYPLDAIQDTPQNLPETSQIAIPWDIVSHSILHGFAAYSLYYNIVVDAAGGLQNAENASLRSLPRAKYPKIISDAAPSRHAGAAIDDSLVVDVPYGLAEVIAHRDVIRRFTSASRPRNFYPLMDLLEASSMATIGKSEATLISFVSHGRLAGYKSFAIPCAGDSASQQSSSEVRAVGIHGLLKYFIACYLRSKYFSATINGPIIPPHIYLAYYSACLELIKKSRSDGAIAHYFDPALVTYGDTAVPLYDLISMFGDINNILADDADDKPAEVDEIILPPKNIRASRPGDPPSSPFHYHDCKFLRISGEEDLESLSAKCPRVP